MSIPEDSLSAGDGQDAQREGPLSSDAQQAAASPTTSSPEEQLPPEARGEANGGPLGCCLGVMVGLLISLSIVVFSRLYADPLANLFSGYLSLLVRIALIIVALAGAILCGIFGWRWGKKFYREYEAPVLKERGSQRVKARTKSVQ